MADRVLVMREGRIVGRAHRAPRRPRSRSCSPRWARRSPHDRHRGGPRDRETGRPFATVVDHERPEGPRTRHRAGPGRPGRVHRRSQNPRFLSGQSIRDILLGTAILAVLAVGQAIVVITRNIDLSVGSVLGLAAFAVGTLMSDHPGLPMIVAILVGLAVGAVCGLVNGVLVRFGQVPALVVTLGTLYVYRGVTYFWAGGQQINADKLPAPSWTSATALGARRPVAGADRADRGLAVAGARAAQLPRSAASCTRWARARRPPSWPASGSAATCSARSWSAARSPAWPGCCSPPGSAPSTRRPAPATS